jgi:hypothetical protein
MVICIAGLMVVACYILKRKPKKRWFFHLFL